MRGDCTGERPPELLCSNTDHQIENAGSGRRCALHQLMARTAFATNAKLLLADTRMTKAPLDVIA